MKVTKKGSTTTFEENEKSVDNTLELIKYATEVQSRIKEDINSDFVLAKITEKDIEAIKELTNNAYLAKRMINDMNYKKYYFWNKGLKRWEHRELDEKTKQRISTIADEIFDIHMLRPQMTCILNRNKEGNPILSGLMKTNAENPEINEPNEETIAKHLYDKMKGKEEKEGK